MKRTSFYEEIRKNKISSFFLIFIVLVIFLSLTIFIALSFSEEYFFPILTIGIIISIMYVLISWKSSNQIILHSVNAKVASEAKYKEYHNLVEGMSIASGIPKPKLYIMQDNQINAFAAGKNPQEALICLTTGALEKLNKRELEGVIAHEMSHIANYDIRFMGLVVVIVGLISIFSEMFLRNLWFNSRNDSNNKNIVFFVIALALAIISPILVVLVQLAISRKREYLADSSAVKFVRSPTGLIGALKKIEQDNLSSAKIPSSVAPLFLSKPNKTHALFQTHPPIEKRISLLERM